MNQHEIDTAVALITGETVTEIRQLGFSLADPLEVDYDPEPRQSLVFDWDSRQPTDWPVY